MPELATVLIAEDEETDAYFVEWAFKKAGLPHNVRRVEDGQQTIEYLSGEGFYADRDRFPLPQLLLLDLKMPRLDGFDVLKWLRNRQGLPPFPVVVLTSSDYPADIKQALQLGAVEYQVKPSNPQNLVRLAQDLSARWLLAKV